MLRKSTLTGLRKLDIRGGEFSKGIMIYGKDKINKFNKLIGFANYKNIYKYQYFAKTGKIPSSREVEIFIRAKAGI